MAIHPQFWPQFWVLVRNYRLLEKDLLVPVQSPNVDLRPKAPQIIIRAIDGDYMGEPRTLDAVTLLRDDIDGTVYRHAAHGVYISSEPHKDHFPLWVCLQRNERYQESHIWVLNLSNFKFLTVPVSKVCWVPTHEAANGDLYTVISSPGRHGYAKEMRLPTVAQQIGLPEQARFKLPSSSLAGFTRLEPERQEALFKKQYMSVQERCRARSGIATRQLPWSRREHQRGQFYAASSKDLENPGFLRDDFSSDEESTSSLLQERIERTQEQIPEGSCRCFCPFSDLGPTCLNPRPLHRHVTDDDCNFGSSHRLHCIFAAHRPDHCVISGSREIHEHCVIYGTPSSLVDSVPTPIEHRGADVNATADNTSIATIEIDSDDEELDIGSLSDELEFLSGESYSRDGEMVESSPDMELWSALSPPYPESRPISPVVEFLPDAQDDPEMSDDDFIFDISAARGMMWNHPDILMTPEPPEMCR
ncbi:hypothetical protein F4782DRAFT_341623 [Xylaria castorea]|nr:hypothetical protein F4782DRAFT_341623 [Xylaria castorea]